MEQEQFELIIRELAGQTLSKIYYFELNDIEVKDDSYWFDDDHERSTYGLDLVTLQGDVFAIVSLSRPPYGIEVYRESVQVKEPHVRKWEINQKGKKWWI